MKELEDALGFSLLNRSTHGIVLTDAGEGLLQNCLQMLASARRLRRRNPQSAEGPVRNAAHPGDERLCAVRSRARDGEIPPAQSRPAHSSFVATDDSNFAEDGFDVIVTSKKPSLPGLIDRDLGEIKHVDLRVADVFPALRPAQEAAGPSRAQLSREPYSAAKGWPFQNASRQFLVEVKGALSSNSSAVLIQMAVQGHGIIRVPHYAVKARLADKTLQAIFEGMTVVAGADARLFFEGKASAGKDHRLHRFPAGRGRRAMTA